MTPADFLAGLAFVCVCLSGGVYLGIFLERRRVQKIMAQYTQGVAAANQKRQWKKSRGVK